jgi:hypothetical protein
MRQGRTTLPADLRKHGCDGRTEHSERGLHSPHIPKIFVTGGVRSVVSLRRCLVISRAADADDGGSAKWSKQEVSQHLIEHLHKPRAGVFPNETQRIAGGRGLGNRRLDNVWITDPSLIGKRWRTWRLRGGR